MTYEDKFPRFIDLLEKGRRDGAEFLIIYKPEVLGDTYDELVESLNRLADAKLSLWILSRKERMTHSRQEMQLK